MNRIGWLFLTVIAVVIGGFLFLVHPVKWTTPNSGAADASVENGGARSLVIPVVGVARSALTETYADPRAGGTRDHRAIDITAPKGTPVLAASAGRVEKLFDSKDGGHTIYVRTLDGKQSHYYAHLDRYVDGLREGQVVAQGEMIAFVGSTGDADRGAPHLHFAIHNMTPTDKWYEGTSVDPYPYLAGKAPTR
ncbi:M23 family metallopeptidase [Sphingomonas paeninsulae]|uniref:M23 family metallopeptidase n=1 Tax=Sphingomonas paeninsulae TaxID=2319844 RepID=A0A494T8R1_SPHPE|nr:M23 family metallopeptidase [Sphingomonas paeninsulae]AYJ85729.1 M23 family metallopeptidase [Sphingomonas paeninsulae]